MGDMWEPCPWGLQASWWAGWSLTQLAQGWWEERTVHPSEHSPPWVWPVQEWPSAAPRSCPMAVLSQEAVASPADAPWGPGSQELVVQSPQLRSGQARGRPASQRLHPELPILGRPG